MDGEVWRAAVHGVAKSWTRLSDFPFTFHFHALEKEMATHSQCFCLENPRDGGAWWAAVSGVAQSPTRLSDLAAAAAVCFYMKGFDAFYQVEFVSIPSFLRRFIMKRH